MLQKCQNKYAFLSNSWYRLGLSVIQNSRNSCRQSSRPLSAFSTLIEPSINTYNKTSVNTDKLLKPVPKLSQATLDTGKQLHSETTVRCSGFKKYDGQRCRRMVKIHPSASNTIAYCYDHGPLPRRKPRASKKSTKRRSLLKTNIGFMRNIEENNINKLFDCWHLWIKPSIDKETRNLILQEMKRPLSTGDRSGYIYAYSFENGPLAPTDKFAYFKIGRTTDPHRRMYQVSIKCNHVPKIIELFPSFPAITNRPFMSTNLETLDRAIQNFPKCPITHRVERLILLELSSLHKKADFKCPECNSYHREWIRVPRLRHTDGTLMTDQELWSSQIRPTILRWIQFGVAASALVTVKDKPIHAQRNKL